MVELNSLNPQSVNVSIPNNGKIDANTNGNSQLAKSWAVGIGLIQGEDYSAKHYATITKNLVENGSSGILDNINDVISNIAEQKEQSIKDLKDEAKTLNSYVTQTYNNAIDNLIDVSESCISEIESVADSIDKNTTASLENSNLAKQWAISEIIVDDTDYSAKYYAEKAKDNSGIFYDELTDEDIDVNIANPEYITEETDPIYSADKPNLALKSEIPTNTSSLVNDSDFATKTDVMSAIASISQFKVSIVTQLPTTGEKMTLYLVAKTGTGNDVYNEYLWIEETSTYEFLGTTAVDLTDYVKNTDYATVNTAGVIKYSNYYGSKLFGDGKIATTTVNLANYSAFPPDGFIGKGTLENVKNDIVKRAITANDITLTDAEKASAQDWLGVTDLIGDIETLLAGV